jgi:hypothetical protein
MCGSATINTRDQGRYKMQLAELQSLLTPGPEVCNCPFMGVPRCVAGRCTICDGPGTPPGCP